MPKVTFEKLSYPTLSPTTMCVQLADSTVRYPEGVVENLMVKVRNTFILVDFVVLDMEGDLGIPLKLGRPFLKDTNVRIDVGTGKISLCIIDAYQCHHWKSAMASALVNGVVGIIWATNESASARSTTIAFYPRVTRSVIYISAGKAAVCRI